MHLKLSEMIKKQQMLVLKIVSIESNVRNMPKIKHDFGGLLGYL